MSFERNHQNDIRACFHVIITQMKRAILATCLIAATVTVFGAAATQAGAGQATLRMCPSGVADANNIPATIGQNFSYGSYNTPGTSNLWQTFAYSTGLEWAWRDFSSAPGANSPQGAYPGADIREANRTQGAVSPGTYFDFSNGCSNYTTGLNALSVVGDVHNTRNVPFGFSGRWVVRAPMGNPSNNASVGFSNMTGTYSWQIPSGSQLAPVSAFYNANIAANNDSRSDLYCMLGSGASGSTSGLGFSFNRGGTGVGYAANGNDDEGCKNYLYYNNSDAYNGTLRNTYYVELRCTNSNLSSCANNHSARTRVGVRDLNLRVQDFETPAVFMNTSPSKINAGLTSNLLSGGWVRGMAYAQYSVADSGTGLQWVSDTIPGINAPALGWLCMEWDHNNSSVGQIRRKKEYERNRYDLSLYQGTRSGNCAAWHSAQNTSINTSAHYQDGLSNDVTMGGWDYDQSSPLFGANKGEATRVFGIDNTAPTVAMEVTSNAADEGYLRGTVTATALGIDPNGANGSGLNYLYPAFLNLDQIDNWSYLVSPTNAPGSAPERKTYKSVDNTTELAMMYLHRMSGCSESMINLVRSVSGCSLDTTSVPDGTRYTIITRATDYAGNAQTVTNSQRMVDNTAPTISTTVNIDEPVWSNGTISIPITANDPTSGVNRAEYCVSQTPSGCSTGTWTPLTPSTNGAKTFSTNINTSSNGYMIVRAFDVAGNMTPTNQWLSIPLRYDDTPPTLTVQGDYTSWTNNPALAVRTLQATDNGSGLDRVMWSWSSGKQSGDPDGGCVPQPDPSWFTGAPGEQECGHLNPIFAEKGQSPPSQISHPLTFGQQVNGSRASGTRQLTAMATDLAGNVTARSFVLRLDFQAPSLSLPEPLKVDDNNFSLAATSNDSHSGPGALTYQICVSGPSCESGGGTWTNLNQTTYMTDVCRENMPGNGANPKAYPCQIRIDQITAGPDGRIWIRAAGQDTAGNQATSDPRPITKEFRGSCPRP